MKNNHPIVTLGIGQGQRLGIPSWRILIRQAWLWGLLDRTLDIGSGDKRARKFAYNVYTINLVGEAFLEDPQPVLLPSSLDITKGNFLTK